MDWTPLAIVLCACLYMSGLFLKQKNQGVHEEPWRVPFWIPLEGFLARTTINSDDLLHKIVYEFYLGHWDHLTVVVQAPAVYPTPLYIWHLNPTQRGPRPLRSQGCPETATSYQQQ